MDAVCRSSMLCRVVRGRSGVAGWEWTLVACYEDSRDVDERTIEMEGEWTQKWRGNGKWENGPRGTKATVLQRCGKNYKQPSLFDTESERGRGQCMCQQRPACGKPSLVPEAAHAPGPHLGREYINNPFIPRASCKVMVMAMAISKWAPVTNMQNSWSGIEPEPPPVCTATSLSSSPKQIQLAARLVTDWDLTAEIPFALPPSQTTFGLATLYLTVISCVCLRAVCCVERFTVYWPT
jgi:hypothetical protein